MKKTNLKQATKINLVLLFIVFVFGVASQVALNIISSSLNANIDQEIHQDNIKNSIGQELIKNIYLLESNYFHLSAFPNKHIKKTLLENIYTIEDTIKSNLEILNRGGRFKLNYDLNISTSQNKTLTISYIPDIYNQFSFEEADVINKIKSINKALISISIEIKNLNTSLENKSDDLAQTISILKLQLKFLTPIFQRLKQNANNIIYKNQKRHRNLLLSATKEKNLYYWLKIVITILISSLLLWFFRRLSLSIERSFTEIEKNKDLIQDILTSQMNIMIVSDGKQILDVSGGFFNYFDNFKNLDDFKQLYACICDLFLKEVGFIYKFTDKNWLEFILQNPQTMHKAKMKKNGVVSTFHITAEKSKKYQRTIISLYDITATEKLHHELMVEKNKAISATKTKDEFLANMSHEIRTPLNAILGFISLLQEKKFDKESHQYLTTIDNSGHSLLGIINDILDFSKIESGKFELDPVQFNPRREFQTVSDLFRAKASQKNIIYSLHLDKNIPNILKADVLRIKQIVSNLLSNAIKFSEEHQPIRLNVKYNEQGSTLFIGVEDQGIGLTKSQQAAVFDAFSQAETSTTRKYGGTGLGLSISSKLATLLGSELKVESEIGKGSHFYFTIPVKAIKGTLEVKKEQYATTFNGHVLLVEDNKTNQMLMSAILKKKNLTFDIANNGIEAIESVQKQDYDLVLMDENMPNLNGIEATKQIRNKGGKFTNLPIIALTANAMTGDREKFIKAGMNDYLTKPVNIKELERIFSSYLIN